MEKGSFYLYADDMVLLHPDGSPDLLTVLPFEVLKLTKDHLVVRFEFGAAAVFAYELDSAKISEPTELPSQDAPRRGRPKRVALGEVLSLTAMMIRVGGKSISNASFQPWTGGFI